MMPIILVLDSGAVMQMFVLIIEEADRKYIAKDGRRIWRYSRSVILIDTSRNVIDMDPREIMPMSPLPATHLGMEVVHRLFCNTPTILRSLYIGDPKRRWPIQS